MLGGFFFFKKLHRVSVKDPINFKPINDVKVAGYSDELFSALGTDGLTDGVGSDLSNLTINNTGEFIKDNAFLRQAECPCDVNSHLLALAKTTVSL